MENQPVEDSLLQMAHHLNTTLESPLVHLPTDSSQANDAIISIDQVHKLEKSMDGPDSGIQPLDAPIDDGTTDASSTIPDSHNSTTVHVTYEPNEKSKRLGRPRAHLKTATLSEPSDSSFENLEKSKISTFRLDDQPLSGPGSRGGDPSNSRKRNGHVTEDHLRKRKQSTLNFSSHLGSTSVGISTDSTEDNGTTEASTTHDNTTSKKTKTKTKELSKVNGEMSVKQKHGPQMIVTVSLKEKKPVVTIKKVAESRTAKKGPKKLDPKKPSTLKKSDWNTQSETKKLKNEKLKSKPKKLVLKLGTSVSKTTIIREFNRNSRPLPGPLIPINFDLYDENIFYLDVNASAVSEPIALGFPVKESPHMFEIVYIITFLTNFHSVVQVGPLGPEDFEEGLDLSNQNELLPVSATMDALFRRLLALVLNRKKPIAKNLQRPAIQELQSKYSTYGLPSEWRDDSCVHEIEVFPCSPLEDQVDMTKPVVTIDDTLEYQEPREMINPFHLKSFEELGLSGINTARERIVMLRCLVDWCLSVSTRVKAHLMDVVAKQEVLGECDTIYGAKSILEGFNQTKSKKKSTELHLAKFTKLAKGLKLNNGSTSSSFLAKDIELGFNDPTSDPLEHPLSLRLNEYIVGDCGFNIGRFYLVRMADVSTGGISSIEKMISLSKDRAAVSTSQASSFKLVVEDVHALLLDSLRVFGLEFDSDGKEIKNSAIYDDKKYWYTVASNCDELSDFLEHLEGRLGIGKDYKSEISPKCAAYKPLLGMYEYLKFLLPILEKCEEVRRSSTGTRSSRRKRVDYNVNQIWDEEYKDDDYSDDGQEDEDGEDEGEYLE